LVNRADVRKALGDDEGALHDLYEALSLAEHSPAVIYNLALALSGLERYAEAIPLWKSYLRYTKNEDYFAVLVAIASFQHSSGDAAGARMALQDMVELAAAFESLNGDELAAVSMAREQLGE
jgi:tetratricopeptide (TPR) repeat protein